MEWLEKRLREQGFAVYWDRQLPLGRDFPRELQQAIEASISGLVVETRASQASQWVEREVYLLLKRAPFEVFPLIPLLLEGDSIRATLANENLQYLDFRNVDWQSLPEVRGAKSCCVACLWRSQGRAEVYCRR